MKTRKRHLIILMALMACLLGWGNAAWAADWDYTKNTTGETTVTLNPATSGNKFKVGSTTYDGIGTVTVSKGTLNIVLNTSAITLINGQIQVTGGTLNIYWGNNYASQSGSSLKRGGSNIGYLFNVTGGTLYIYGKSDKNISIHGNANNWTLDATNHTATFSTGTRAEKAIMYISGGTLKLNRVSLVCNWNDSGDGGAFVFRTGPYTVDIQNSSIGSCYAKNSGAVIDMNASASTQSTVTITNTSISGNFTYSAGSTTGGNIRTSGNTKCNLSMSGCTVTNNHSRGSGGVFHWNTGFGTLTLSSCTMKNNWTSGSGGALLLTGSATLSGCTFESNSSSNDGGAIFVGTYSSSTYIASYNPNDGSVTLDASTTIKNNTAGGKGGGICVDVSNITIAGDNSHSGYTVQNHTVNLNVNGATIQSNKASYGGGIYMTRSTTKYTTNINLNSGTIDNNTATNNGGGLYATTSASNDAIPVNVGSTSGTITFKNNKAVNGAGIYINNGNITLKSGNIGTSGNANACTTGSGGGLYITGNRSVISIQGGNIQYNTASSGNGGGIYVASSSSTGTSITGSTKVQYNQATNGAGAYINSGNLTINGSSVSVNNNTASTSGGGVYVNGGTVGITSATIGSNTAATDGGGILVSSTAGAVTLSSATVSSNTATSGNGGGLCTNKSVTVTSSTFTGNKAANTSSNGGGGGIYATGSGTTVSIGGSSSAKSLFTSNQARLGGAVYATSNVTSITVGDATIGNSGAANTASQEGGGIYAAGPVTLNAGSVTQYNTAGTNGGGVYVTGSSSTVIVKGNVNNNTATNNGGGIYVNSSSSAGTTISNSAQVNSNTAKNGAGAFINSGKLTISDSGTQVNSNVASVNGGGLYVNGGTVGITSATVSSNTAATSGGGIYSNGGTVTLSSATLSSNTATSGDGGGVWASSTVNVNSSTLSGNKAPNNSNGKGGGIYAEGSATNINITRTNSSSASSVLKGNQARLGGGVYASSVNLVQVDYGTIGASGEANTASADGGGIYAAGPVTLNTGSVVQCNTATNDGGGVYVDNGTFTMTAGTIGGNSATYANIASGNGGGVYVKGASAKVAVSGGTISYNSAPSTSSNKGNGGGIYVESTGNDGTAISGTATLANNTAKQNGGGLYVANGTIAVSSTGGITSNQAQTGNGGGIYMGGGSCSVTAGAIGASGSANQAVNGGGIYATGGTISVSGGNVNYNTASTSGGGIYSAGGTVNVSSGNVNNNTATTDGGGIYTNGTVNFSNGNIQNNAATNGNGGGVYIYSSGRLNVSGNAEISANTVQSGWGGGVYQGGTMYADGSSFKVINNTRNAAKAATKNNVYLPDNQTIEVGPNITTAVNLGVYTENVATENHDIPVLTTASGNEAKLQLIYDAMMDETSNIRDDRNMHRAKYSSTDDPLTLYFGLVNFEPLPDDPDNPGTPLAFENPINTPEKLHQFMCWVNGVNGYNEPHPLAEGIVTADIDMSSDNHYWIPIGEHNSIGTTLPYKGTFNGNGHVITGLQIDDGMIEDWGLFGVIAEGAYVHDIYVNGCNLTKDTRGSVGILVGKMLGGTVENCTSEGTIVTTSSSCVIGGLVGTVTSTTVDDETYYGIIQSSYAGTNQTGYQMGGLVGDLDTGCSIYNSHANASFSSQSGSTAYVGGLVGVNKGTVENCYSRVRGTVPGATYFGLLAGDNTNGSLVSSYITTAYNNYTATNKTGTQTSLNQYDPVIAPYLYNRSGDNAVGSGNTLMGLLNSWVGNHSGYSPWKRTSMGGYQTGAGDINGDYPIHQHAGYKCVASTNGIDLDYAANLDAMLTRHTTSATVNLWAHDVTSEATGTGVVVCIDENISLLQSDDTKDIEAYTCQTLPGNPRSWHYLSSSLEDSGIGFSYTSSGQVAFSWSPDPCGLIFSTDDDHALFPHDMPAVSSMDLYCFYEPEYHWINFKRNSNSHWHMNATTVPIIYNNETELEPGKGYLVSIDKDQLLQNRGTLNNGSVTATLSYTESNAWAGLLGYNLVGNPYQSYLNFNRFAAGNRGIWAEGTEPTYAVYDDALGGYVQYKEGTSRGARVASGTLNMHQGFLVRTASASSITFNNTMRTNDGTGVTFREDQPAYPLINLKVTDNEGVNDFAVLELGRDTDAGAEKLRANDSKGWLYLRYNDENYGILFRSDADSQPLWFDATEAGTYTLGWETANGEFEALTLVDNITGMRTDMLARDNYVFEADPEQYASRFKIVIGEYKDIDEYNEDGPSTGSGTERTFAFMNNGTLVVNGEGSLEIMDVLGRVISVEDLHDSQNMVPMPQGAAGMYVLRLTCDGVTQVQKIVVE